MSKMIVHMRDMTFSRSPSATLLNSALVADVGSTLIRWASTTKGMHGVLIGRLALAFYSRPRMTTEIHMLFISHDDIPTTVDGFDKHSTSAFKDKSTNIEIELVSATTINIPPEVVAKVFETARNIEGMRVASREGLIVLKLYGMLTPKRKRGDTADIQTLLETDPKASVSGWPLTTYQREVLEDIRAELISY
jgi:hypothetical protein